MKREWRCCNSNCLALLGKDEALELELKYKDASYVIAGPEYTVIAICPRCKARNERRFSHNKVL